MVYNPHYEKIAWFFLCITCMEIMKSHEDEYFLRSKYNFGMKCKTCEQNICVLKSNIEHQIRLGI